MNTTGLRAIRRSKKYFRNFGIVLLLFSILLLFSVLNQDSSLTVNGVEITDPILRRRFLQVPISFSIIALGLVLFPKRIFFNLSIYLAKLVKPVRL